jgi:hypothetical protein
MESSGPASARVMSGESVARQEVGDAFPHRNGFEYIGKCPLCGISASSTPLAASVGRYDRHEFCSPYMNMRGHGSKRKMCRVGDHGKKAVSFGPGWRGVA